MQFVEIGLSILQEVKFAEDGRVHVVEDGLDDAHFDCVKEKGMLCRSTDVMLMLMLMLTSKEDRIGARQVIIQIMLSM